jgi:hypothetical protein
MFRTETYLLRRTTCATALKQNIHGGIEIRPIGTFLAKQDSQHATHRLKEIEYTARRNCYGASLEPLKDGAGRYSFLHVPGWKKSEAQCAKLRENQPC